MNKFKNYLRILPILMVMALGLTLFVPAHQSYADTAKSDACAGVGTVSGTGGCNAPNGSPSVDSLIRTVINILSIVVGFAAVVMIIIGGFRYVLSGGDSNQTNSARNTILYALVGVVIAVLAQVIVHFVLTKVTS